MTVPPEQLDLAVRIYDRLGFTAETPRRLEDIDSGTGMRSHDLVQAEMLRAKASDQETHLLGLDERILRVSVRLAGAMERTAGYSGPPRERIESASVILRYRRSVAGDRGDHDSQSITWPADAAGPSIDGALLEHGGDPDWPVLPAVVFDHLAAGLSGLERARVVVTYEPLPDHLADPVLAESDTVELAAPGPEPRGRLGLVVFAAGTTLASLLFLWLWRRASARAAPASASSAAALPPGGS